MKMLQYEFTNLKKTYFNSLIIGGWEKPAKLGENCLCYKQKNKK